MSIPKRSDVPAEFTWDVSHIFADEAAWQEALGQISAYGEKISSFAGTLGSSAKTLLNWFAMQDEIEVLAGKVYGYASLCSDVDTADSHFQAMRGKAMSALVGLSGAASFAAPEIMAIPEETLERFYAEEPALNTYRRSLYQLRCKAAHILPPECEKILATAREIARSADQIGSTLRNADLRFPDVTDKDGNVHPLSNGSFVPLLESPDRDLREKVFNAYYDRLGEFTNF